MFDDEYYQYKLRGVIIHIGNAESGHYYSLINVDNRESWVEFNDTIVRPFNNEDLPSHAFGGFDREFENTDMNSNSG